ncbi:unnamed protein product [Moneuplotes crassus]|uniref:Uncharacterized protein n=1 Tax=Euplotes crassus TaxID=5936 RepID=A0AAD2D6K1_EUPCR|nr:unnamed protein product [Moneuplotes crassus]
MVPWLRLRKDRNISKFTRLSPKILMIVIIVVCNSYAMRNFHLGPPENRLDLVNRGGTSHYTGRLQIKAMAHNHIGIKNSHILTLLTAALTICLFIFLMLKCVEMSNYARVELKKSRKHERIRKANRINEKLCQLGIYRPVNQR